MTAGGDLPRLSECRVCHDPIRFVQLDSGKAMPVNPKPNHDGNVCARLVMAISSAHHGKELRGYVVTAARKPDPTWLRFTPHYATCSDRPRAADPKPAPAPDPALF